MTKTVQKFLPWVGGGKWCWGSGVRGGVVRGSWGSGVLRLGVVGVVCENCRMWTSNKF